MQSLNFYLGHLRDIYEIDQTRAVHHNDLVIGSIDIADLSPANTPNPSNTSQADR